MVFFLSFSAHHLAVPKVTKFGSYQKLMLDTVSPSDSVIFKLFQNGIQGITLPVCIINIIISSLDCRKN